MGALYDFFGACMSMSVAPDVSAFLIDFHGQPALRVAAPDGASVTVALHGGTIVSWIPAGGKERLYLSDKAVFDGETPIRGGVPVIFPQFGTRGSLPRHGFARTRPWLPVVARIGEDFALATVRLSADDTTRAVYDHDFVAELTVMVGSDRLDIEFEVMNTGSVPLSFTGALHTYLRVSEVETIQVDGLQGLRYFDARSGEEKTERASELIVEDAVDRVYFRSRGALLSEPHRRLLLQHDGFCDLVVWNPWEAGCAGFGDLPKDGFRRFICLESAVVETPVNLEPGGEWVGRLSFSQP